MKNALLKGLGGPMGRHAKPVGIWFNPLPWTLLAAAAVFAVLYFRHLPCLQTLDSNVINAYIRVCYSDIQTTFLSSGIGRGASPLGETILIYPPLVAVLVVVLRMLSGGGSLDANTSLQEQIDVSLVFFGLSALVLFGSLLVVSYCLLRVGRLRGRKYSWDGLLFAASPVVLATGLINFDLFALALAALGLLLFARKSPVEAGIVFGLAASAGTMPIGIVLAVTFVSLLRAGLRGTWKFGVATLVTFFAVHLPLMIDNFDRVYAFYHQEINKDFGYGSGWYFLTLLGAPLRAVGSLGFMFLMLGLAALFGYLYVTRAKPRVGSLIAVVLFAAAILGPAYPPQTGLWLLFALIIARPYRRELIAFTVTQVIYYLAIWGWLGGGLTTAQSGPYWVYWLALVARIAVEVWLVVEILLDIADPTRDRLQPDPLGGQLNDVPNACPQPIPTRAAVEVD